MKFATLQELKDFLNQLSPAQLQAKLASIKFEESVPTGHAHLSVTKVADGPFVFEVIGSSRDN